MARKYATFTVVVDNDGQDLIRELLRENNPEDLAVALEGARNEWFFDEVEKIEVDGEVIFEA